MMLTADQMRSLPAFFADMPDPRRKQGQRHFIIETLTAARLYEMVKQRGYPGGPSQF